MSRAEIWSTEQMIITKTSAPGFLVINRQGHLTMISIDGNEPIEDLTDRLIKADDWAGDLSFEEIKELFTRFRQQAGSGQNHHFETAFCEHFGLSELPETLFEEQHSLLISQETGEKTKTVADNLFQRYGLQLTTATLQSACVDGKEWFRLDA